METLQRPNQNKIPHLNHTNHVIVLDDSALMRIGWTLALQSDVRVTTYCHPNDYLNVTEKQPPCTVLLLDRYFGHWAMDGDTVKKIRWQCHPGEIILCSALGKENPWGLKAINKMPCSWLKLKEFL